MLTASVVVRTIESPRIFESEVGSQQRQLCKSVRLIHVFSREKGLGIKSGNFPGYLRALPGRIERADSFNPAHAIDCCRPKLVSAYANRGNNPHSRNDYTHK